MSERNQKLKPDNADGNRTDRVSGFAQLKRSVSLTLDTTIEKISSRFFNMILIIVNFALILLLVYGIFIADNTKTITPVNPDENDESTSTATDEETGKSNEELLAALHESMIPKTRVPKPKFPFAKVNSWGDVKTSGGKWFTQALFDEYVFLLDELKLSTADNTRKTIDSIVSQMQVYFESHPTSDASQFLADFFREYLLLRSYKDADAGNPSEILKNLGGSEFDIAFLVLSALSKIGVTPEIHVIETDSSTQIVYILNDKTLIYFAGQKPDATGTKIQPNDLIQMFLKYYISKADGVPKRVKLYEFLEDISPTVEVYRSLCNLYEEWSENTEDPTLKKYYYEKMKHYREFLPIDNAEDLYNIAQGDFKENNIAEAWENFNRLIKTFPDYTPTKGEPAHYYLAFMGSDKFAAGAIEATILSGFLDELDYQNKLHVPVLTKCAYLFYERQKFTEAIKVLNNLELNGHGDVRLFSTRCEIYLELKQTMPAIANIKAAITLDPRNRRFCAKLIQILIDSEMFEEACRECENAAKSEAKMIYALKIGAFIAEHHLNNLSLAERLLLEYDQLSR